LVGKKKPWHVPLWLNKRFLNCILVAQQKNYNTTNTKNTPTKANKKKKQQNPHAHTKKSLAKT
jgi:hypothetical protein